MTMGNPATQPEPAIQHFSHPHLLQLTNYQPQQTLFIASCSSCNQKVSGWNYTCTICNYFLHISCSQMPQQITHPVDQNHILCLLSKPVYAEGFFNCDACGNQGNGFCYHCGTCNIDIHTTWATLPLLLTQQSHHHHHLNLNFSIPYPNRAFRCDVCNKLGSNQWLYRCNVCEFYAHLGCATTEPIISRPTPAQQVPVQQVQMQYYSQMTATSAIPQYQVVGTPLMASRRPPMQKYAVPNSYVPGVSGPIVNMPVPAAGTGNQGNALLNHTVKTLITGDGLGQALVQGMLGGGGGSGSGIVAGTDFGSGDGGMGGAIDLGGLVGGSSGVDLGGLKGGTDFGGQWTR